MLRGVLCGSLHAGDFTDLVQPVIGLHILFEKQALHLIEVSVAPLFCKLSVAGFQLGVRRIAFANLLKTLC